MQLCLRSTPQRRTVQVACGSHSAPASAVRSPSPRKCSWSALRAALLRQLVSSWARASDGPRFANVRAARVTLHTPVRQASSPRKLHWFLRRSAPTHLARLQTHCRLTGRSTGPTTACGNWLVCGAFGTFAHQPIAASRGGPVSYNVRRHKWTTRYSTALR